MNPATVVRYFYALGWLLGVVFGVSLLRAIISGGEWWAFPPVLLATAVAVAFLRVRKTGENEAEVR